MTSLEVRQAHAEEFEQVVACCGAALGWRSADPNADFFRWKHRDNAFGPSPIWVAVDHGTIVGVRAMMRWQLQRNGTMRRMVRAVDTATLPTHQGQGIFRKLTETAVDELTADGVDGVFNTPNTRSRPGYLKMGWVDLGRAPIGLRLRSLLAAPRIVRSRVGAGKWGEPIDIGERRPDLDGLLDEWRPPSGWHTPMSADYLEWRYGFEPLGYRFIDDLVIRVRRRGAVRELSVCEQFGNGTSVGDVLRRSRADVAIRGGNRMAGAFVPAPLGPRLTWRTLADSDAPSIDQLSLSLGTLELF